MTGNIREIGPYRVEAEVGRGGMGVVYRAIDTRLGRDVAIKALPEHLADDAERLARFEREARTLASLNHPNVAGIHGIEEHEGRRYLVLEYVDGETLAERLDRGPLAIDEALEICGQIAAGVGAAHEAGVIHRDLKPGNVKLTPYGKVKVLDFGLAKEAEGSFTSVEMTRSPTITVPYSPTAEGVILGTVPYMSPEQARGRPVDRRSDIWSFGVVLYECLTGMNPFVGETVSDSIATILQTDIDLHRLPQGTPPAVRRALRRCLERDKERRFRDIGDVRLELTESREGGDAEAPPAAAVGGGRATVAWGTAAAALLATTATFVWFGLRTPSAPVTYVELKLPEGRKLAFGPEVANTVAITRDGRTVAVVVADRDEMVDYYQEYSIDSRLWLRSLDAPQGRIVDGSDGAMSPFFSPDGRWVAFFARGKLRKAPVDGGGAVETLCDARDPWGGSWPEDDLIMFSSSRAEGLVMQTVNPAGGSPTPLAELDAAGGEQEHNFPSLLPGGTAVLYQSWRAGETSFARSVVLDLESGRRTTLVEGGFRPEYHPPYLLYNIGPRLFGARMKTEPPAVIGDPVEISDDVLVDPEYLAGQWAASPSGTVVYAPGGQPETGRQLVWVGADGAVDPIPTAGKIIGSATTAPDDRVVYAVIDSNSDIFSYDVRRGTTRRLTVDPTWDGRPRPSNRGDRIAFSSYRTGREQAFILEANGEVVQALASDGSSWPTSWSRDDRALAITVQSAETALDVWLLPLDEEGAEPVPLVATAANERNAAFSPTSDSIAYVSDESGVPEVWVRSSTPGSESGAVQVSSGGGAGPMWSPDGRGLYYRSGGDLVAVEVAYEPSLRLGQPHLILSDPSLRVGGVARDGRFLAIQSEPMPEVTSLHLLFGYDRLVKISGARP